jgi:flagellar assembly protein FliH
MSSKLLPSDAPQPIEPVPWRQVGAGRGQPPEAAPPPPVASADDIRREGERRAAEARAAGLREGEAAGRSRAAAELQPVLERLAASIDEIASLRPRLRREAESDTVRLALAIARRVILRELSVDPGALHGIVLGALDRLQSAEPCRLRVHPSQVAALSALLQSRGGASVEVVADGSRDPGAVVFETARGNLDASVDAQLGEIERGLAAVLRRQS